MVLDKRILGLSDKLLEQISDKSITDGTIWESMGLSRSAFYRLKPKALEIVQERLKERSKIIAEVTNSEVIEAAKNGLKSDLEIEAHLCKIALGELDVEETTNSEQFGLTTFKRKPTPSEMSKAADLLFKKRGSYAAEKHDIKSDIPVLQFNFPNAKD